MAAVYGRRRISSPDLSYDIPRNKPATVIDHRYMEAEIPLVAPIPIKPLLLVPVSLAALWAGARAFYWAALEYPLPTATAVVLLIIHTLIRGVIVHRRNLSRGWRIGGGGRDEIFYEERIDGRWERLTIHAELLTGKIHRDLDLSSIKYPEWAKAREVEITNRIKGEYPPPKYSYR